MKINRKIYFNLLIILLIFFVDQLSKFYVINNLSPDGTEVYLTNFLNLQLIWNNGIAFGLLSFDSNFYYNIITLVISVIIFTLILFIKNLDTNSYFYSMVVGGALGNLVDRIRYYSVPDFIDFHISSFHWFVFNIADIFVSLGIFCLIIAEIFFNKNKLNEKI